MSDRCYFWQDLQIINCAIFYCLRFKQLPGKKALNVFIIKHLFKRQYVLGNLNQRESTIDCQLPLKVRTWLIVHLMTNKFAILLKKIIMWKHVRQAWMNNSCPPLYWDGVLSLKFSGLIYFECLYSKMVMCLEYLSIMQITSTISQNIFVGLRPMNLVFNTLFI